MAVSFYRPVAAAGDFGEVRVTLASTEGSPESHVTTCPRRKWLGSPSHVPPTETPQLQTLTGRLPAITRLTTSLQTPTALTPPLPLSPLPLPPSPQCSRSHRSSWSHCRPALNHAAACHS